MTPTEKAIRDFCGHRADWWPSASQVQAMLALAQPCPTCEALARTVMLDQTSHDKGLGVVKKLSEENLNAMVLNHEQQIKDIAMHLLELKKLVMPMMEFQSSAKDSVVDFARAIEAKLKEKNA